MIWTDGLFISVNDLQRVDSEVQQVATAEKINLIGNFGIIRGGIEAAGQEMTKMMVAFGGYLSSGDISPNHTSAVLNIGLGNSVRSKALLSQIVVSGLSSFSWNHVKEWVVHWVLQTFYRDAFNRTVKDRYEAKMRYYKSEIDRRLRPSIMGLGIPMIIQPLAAPAALFERSPVDYLGSLNSPYGNNAWTTPGTFGNANLSSVNSVGTSGGSFTVVVTYVNQGMMQQTGQFLPDSTKYVSSSKNGNAESAGSPLASITVPAGSAMQVSIASLYPPNGLQDPATRLLCVTLPLAATGWNVYAGPINGTLTLQNNAPISIFTKTFMFPGDPTTTGVPLGTGQYDDRKLSLNPTRQRA